MQHFHALRTTLTLTAGLTILGSAQAQGGLQQVPSGPTEKGFGKDIEQAENLLDHAIGVLQRTVLDGDHRTDDPETLIGGAEAWLRAVRADLGAEGTEVVERHLRRAGTNLLGRSSDSVLTIEDVDDYRAAVLDARVERALRRLARSASDGGWSQAEYTDVVDAWSDRVEMERRRQERQQRAGVAKPQKLEGYGGPQKTFEKQRMKKAAGAFDTEPEIIIDYGPAGTSLTDSSDPYGTGVGQAELVILLQEGLDRELGRMRGRRGAGLERTFLLVTEFRLKVARQRYRQQAGAGEVSTLQKIHVFDLALQRQRQAAQAGRPK